ncbi:MAG: TIGR03067 domain-containing protein [Planctomycetota bacterium]|nr:MAG: TIGR03067 domain-containing protein [Planctomycetota bacterium]
MEPISTQALNEFYGTWDIVAVDPPGSTKEAARLVFRDDHSYAALDVGGKELWAGTFDLDSTVTPKIWDHRSFESQESGSDVLGIYVINGDQLKVCCVVGVWKDGQWIGKPRPSEFDRSSSDVVLEMRRSTTNGRPITT